jgi:hypothetical protein
MKGVAPGFCQACRVRLAQHAGGLCRRCWRKENSGAMLTQVEIEAERQARIAARRAALVAPPPERPPVREVTIRGVVYEIKWDGTH